ncbi:phosphoribosyltransferase family protein [Sandarakinorhabdus sp. AAP62]|uniref:phosphoribosyltransferase n=1 Tax=Sandarakinorhabdus sp. AAP62 TaxID=1248916 RepID=UPI00037DE797|nr:phosphoribosyltransferase family protein [Sandarakinorhabdus sp. AAP62]
MTDQRKIWLTADDLLGDSFRLARQVLESGFRPTHLVGIWRGGAPIGIAVQEFFDVHGVECDHIAIRTASYTGIDQQSKTVKVYALGYLIDTLNADDRLLVIDDVFDSGRSIEAVLTELKARCRANMPADIRIATVWYKPARNQTALKPDYFIHESNEWLVFPHEIDGLTSAEIRAHKPAADVILAPIEGLTK